MPELELQNLNSLPKSHISLQRYVSCCVSFSVSAHFAYRLIAGKNTTCRERILLSFEFKAVGFGEKGTALLCFRKY
jgi:hypothetical protein